MHIEIVKSYTRTVGTTGIACGEDVRLRSRKIDKLFSVKQEPRDYSRGRFRNNMHIDKSSLMCLRCIYYAEWCKGSIWES